MSVLTNTASMIILFKVNLLLIYWNIKFSHFFSSHPGAELSSEYVDKYLPWSLGLSSPHIFIWISISIPLTCNLATRLINLPLQVLICSWIEWSNAAWSALLRGTTRRCTGRVLKPGLDLNPDPESCTLPLDQLAASAIWFSTYLTNALQI